ncbi:MAG: hypothetical protein GC149_06430 [Gammaproteobacteria bacterium]|nr:hypothetical protein [Gammaproteobacteria bacterium]
MNKYSRILTGFCLSFTLASSWVLAADQDQDRDRDQTRDQLQTQDKLRDQDRIYGSQLMTQQERIEYRNRMRTATTAEERLRIRNEHHKLMQERARERGVSLPDMPPARGMGGGMGPGGGGGRAR